MTLNKQFHRISRKYGSSAKYDELCGSARNSVANGKLWALLIIHIVIVKCRKIMYDIRYH